jgi:hypothetical protein
MQKFNIEKHPSFSSSDINISPESILKRLEYPKEESDEYFLSTVKSCISIARDLLDPQVTMTIHNIENLDLSEGILTLDNTKFNIYKIIANQLKDSEKIVVFACTNGKKIEKHYESLFKKGDMLEGYICSLIGSEAAESLAELTHNFLAEQAQKHGLSVTNRFSPGYCKWNVAEQHLLFHMFPQNSTSINLNDSALMDPIKSVSGIIGIGSNVKKQEYQCKACTEDKCHYREKIRL